MSRRCLELIGVAAVFMAVVVLMGPASVPVAGQAPQARSTAGAAAKADPAAKTQWGEPDLQGIWTQVHETPLQRSPRFADKASFTDQERVELDRQRASILRRDKRLERGTERDVAGAYNALYTSVRPTGKRTSMIVDPPDGRIPPLTPETANRSKADREFRLALLQPTQTCKNQETACAGGKYGPVSPRREDPTLSYNTARMNRKNGPEDGSLAERCMTAALPDFGGFRQIVQSPGSVSIQYDTGQGQGWQRHVPMNAGPHLPSHIRQWWGDSRGRWEGNTLVVDVTNFSPKSSFREARENLHLIERWTRIDADTLEYAVTIEDPTTWTKPWTVKQELTRQDPQANRIYSEPRCHEGNYGLPALLAGTRTEERAFAEGRGPDPATKDTATDFGAEGGVDVLTAQ